MHGGEQENILYIEEHGISRYDVVHFALDEHGYSYSVTVKHGSASNGNRVPA